jgi:glucuronokinase
MSTGRSVVATCPARAALAGNPSDGYGGAVVAVPIPDLCATVATSEADEFAIHVADPELRRLLDATAAVFAEEVAPLPAVSLSASTTIPRSVGLAGSSAFVIATLRALGGWSGLRWDRLALARLALAVERDRLGIQAGLQDRLVQSVGRPVSMTFDPVGFEPLDIDEDLPLFVAWSTGAARSSDAVHRSLRRRHDAGDPEVHELMRALAVQAQAADRAVRDRDRAGLAAAIDRTFDLRTRLVDVGDAQQRLVRIGRRFGAAVNSAGSGGSVVGLAPSTDDVEAIIEAYRRADTAAITV